MAIKKTSMAMIVIKRSPTTFSVAVNDAVYAAYTNIREASERANLLRAVLQGLGFIVHVEFRL